LIHTAMVITFASGWTTPAEAHVSCVPFWTSRPNP
jgi:hypothetical protein